jgi:dihydroorotase
MAAAAFGMVGLESALSVVQASVVDNNGMLDWADGKLAFANPGGDRQLDGYDRESQSAHRPLHPYDPSVSRVFETTQLRGKGINSPYRHYPPWAGRDHGPPRPCHRA